MAKHLTYDEISKYFACPLYEACIYLKVEKHHLKERLTELGIKKWPYRKYQKKDLKKPEGMFVTFEIDLGNSPKNEPLLAKGPSPQSSPKFEPLRKQYSVSPSSSPQTQLLTKNFEMIGIGSPPPQTMSKTFGTNSPHSSPKSNLLEKSSQYNVKLPSPNTWLNIPDFSSEEKKKPRDRMSIHNLIDEF
jgi:hypothetical protein